MNENNNCYLSEIYSAIQGESALVGVRQILVRFSACDLRCVWCDTPGSLIKEKICSIEKALGTRLFNKIKNPVDASVLLLYIKNLNPDLHHSISLTGGEPLVQSKFLSGFLPMLKKEIKIPIYLETGGHKPEELKSIVEYLDYISMDFKLPSSAKAGDLWEKHKQFLEIALCAKKLISVWIKIVVTKETLSEELKYSINLVKSVNKTNKIVEVFLQPVSQMNGSKPPSEKDLLNIHSELLKKYPHVRVVPQVHRLIGQR